MNFIIVVGVIAGVVAACYTVKQYFLNKNQDSVQKAKEPKPSENSLQTELDHHKSPAVIDLSEIYTPSTFHGRRNEIRQLTDLIAQGKRVITLLGMGGIGKSVLACKLAERVKDKFDAIWGFSFKTDVTLQGFLARIGKRLLGDGAQQLPQEELKSQMLNAL